jgi:RHS repeat-associated protein
VRSSPQTWIDREFYAIVTDLVGTPTELVDPAGHVAWHGRTTLWGLPAAVPAAHAYTPLRFPGQYHDQETGENYNFLRYYNPAGGTYTSADPMGLNGGPNPNSYVPNPLDWMDPFGLAYKRVYHYTDKNGYNGIRSGKPHHIRPGNAKHGAGPFVTPRSPADLTAPNAYKKLGLTGRKHEYVVEFDVDEKFLKPIPGARGQFIFEIPGGIRVNNPIYLGPVSGWSAT